MAQLLSREDVADWYARRWHGRQPFLTSFLSDVNANIRDGGASAASFVSLSPGRARTAYPQLKPLITEGLHVPWRPDVHLAPI
ncbi:hypothetical protein FBY35_0455 [Streptomyces sp. SLBN-118]|uniref:hypothetical protein n=1 Tax=Streptomyces sp. SLBN-118 TaxID=2768454 RepID=UPI001154866A|nr:hypothetical protein [Streptomyces sp. SLBN-118]TQK50142.1 hypothetical protein FBY35_0455 [Streptomyces sp. SLBN-118]